MAQVIKVSDELYRWLKEKAAERGIPIKEAIGEELQEARAQVEKNQALLAQKERELEALQAMREDERKRHALQIANLKGEIHRLREALSSYRTRVDELSLALELEKRGRKKAEEAGEKWERVAPVLLPLGLVGGAIVTPLLHRAFEEGAKELFLPLLGGAIGAAVGNHLKGELGFLIGAGIGVLAGGIACHLWHNWQEKEKRLRRSPAMLIGYALVTRSGSET